jgi:KUP system potassium uptake protein
VHGLALTATNLIGIVSLILWGLTLILSLKYVSLVLRANNRGEGGIMALMALATTAVGNRPRLAATLTVAGVIGASLFYGDAVLTPAISVLSAIEGLEVGTAAFKPYVAPLACGVLVALFLIQRHGTGVVGSVFGPICLVWFIALAAAGIDNIVRAPAVLAALDPRHAVHFVTAHGMASFLVLGSVLLAITGAEALYADMGHFGKRAVRAAWFTVAAPALVLNYFGQGALLLARPEALENPFYHAFPAWALYPMIALATAATVIASQATISGAFSMTQQAIQLGFLPRMTVRHTSARTFGQIYVPAVNWTLLVVVAGAVVGFGSSTALASAYGVAVMGTMLVTTFLTYFVLRYGWRFPLALCVAATGFFALIDLTLFAAAMHKVLEGGWFPLLLASIVCAAMLTWRSGRARLQARLREGGIPLDAFLRSLFASPPLRVPGTAVFLSGTPGATPHALLHSLKHFKALHERNVFVTVAFDDVPVVSPAERVQVEDLGSGAWRVVVRFGFIEQPDLPAALAHCAAHGLDLDPLDTSYFLSREKVVTAVDAGRLAHFRDAVFAAAARNARNVTDYFDIPPNRVVELGTRVEL